MDIETIHNAIDKKALPSVWNKPMNTESLVYNSFLRHVLVQPSATLTKNILADGDQFNSGGIYLSRGAHRLGRLFVTLSLLKKLPPGDVDDFLVSLCTNSESYFNFLREHKRSVLISNVLAHYSRGVRAFLSGIVTSPLTAGSATESLIFYIDSLATAPFNEFRIEESIGLADGHMLISRLQGNSIEAFESINSYVKHEFSHLDSMSPPLAAAPTMPTDATKRSASSNAQPSKKPKSTVYVPQIPPKRFELTQPQLDRLETYHRELEETIQTFSQGGVQVFRSTLGGVGEFDKSTASNKGRDESGKLRNIPRIIFDASVNWDSGVFAAAVAEQEGDGDAAGPLEKFGPLAKTMGDAVQAGIKGKLDSLGRGRDNDVFQLKNTEELNRVAIKFPFVPSDERCSDSRASSGDSDATDGVLRITHSAKNAVSLEDACHTALNYLIASHSGVGVYVRNVFIFSAGRFDSGEDRYRGKFGVAVFAQRMVEAKIDDGYISSMWQLLKNMATIGMVYADIHPGNVLATCATNKAKLIDFDNEYSFILTSEELEGGLGVYTPVEALYTMNTLAFTVAIYRVPKLAELYTSFVGFTDTSSGNLLRNSTMLEQRSLLLARQLDKANGAAAVAAARLPLAIRLFASPWAGGIGGMRFENKRALENYYEEEIDDRFELIKRAIFLTLYWRAVKQPLEKLERLDRVEYASLAPVMRYFARPRNPAPYVGTLLSKFLFSREGKEPAPEDRAEFEHGLYM
jgi:hypothetical protein